MSASLPNYSPFIKHWHIDREIVFLNHGSFGAVPAYVLEQQDVFRKQLHEDPIRYFVRTIEPIWWKNKALLASFLGTHSSNITLIKNATQGVNTILNNITLTAQDAVLITNHIYGACANNLKVLSAKQGFEIIMAEVPFPIQNEDQVVEAILNKVTKKVKVLLVDHVTSATGLVFPVEKIIQAIKGTGIQIIVDGAHAPGMLDLNLDKIDADYYTGNCHKWLFTPNGCAFIYVKDTHQQNFKPGFISHLYDKPLEDEKERWSAQFFWQGTEENTAPLCIEAAFDFVQDALQMTHEQVRLQNRSLLLQASKEICNILQIEPMAPESMLAGLCTFFLKYGPEPTPYGFNYFSPFGKALYEKYKIEVPTFRFGMSRPAWYFRISPQLYNQLEQYQYLAKAIAEIK